MTEKAQDTLSKVMVEAAAKTKAEQAKAAREALRAAKLQAKAEAKEELLKLQAEDKAAKQLEAEQAKVAVTALHRVIPPSGQYMGSITIKGGCYYQPPSEADQWPKYTYIYSRSGDSVVKGQYKSGKDRNGNQLVEYFLLPASRVVAMGLSLERCPKATEEEIATSVSLDQHPTT